MEMRTSDLIKSINKFVAKAESKYLGWIDNVNFADNPSHLNALRRQAERAGHTTQSYPFRYRDKNNQNEATHYKVVRTPKENQSGTN